MYCMYYLHFDTVIEIPIYKYYSQWKWFKNIPVNDKYFSKSSHHQKVILRIIRSYRLPSSQTFLISKSINPSCQEGKNHTRAKSLRKNTLMTYKPINLHSLYANEKKKEEFVRVKQMAT